MSATIAELREQHRARMGGDVGQGADLLALADLVIAALWEISDVAADEFPDAAALVDEWEERRGISP